MICACGLSVAKQSTLANSPGRNSQRECQSMNALK
jgi:hypothetical protein